MTGTATPTTPQRPIPKDLRQNAEARRVIVSPFPATETSPRLTAAGAESVRDHSREIFVQCLYMVPFAGNAMSLYDVGVDIYRICSEPGGTKKVINWGILAIDAIGVSVWDLAAPLVIVEEAGGRFSDLEGVARPDVRAGVASNGLLHDDALALAVGRR